MSPRRSAAGRRSLQGGTLGLALLLALSPASRADGEWVTHARYVMGTLWTLEAKGTGSEEAIAGAVDEIRRLDALLSTYRPESELSRVNREAGRGWVRVQPETFELLRRSFGYSRTSRGAFDPTVGTLIRAWGFKYLDYRKPDHRAIDAARAKVGYQHVRLDSRRGVHFEKAGLELDLGAIAKGYAVDRALAHLKAKGMLAGRVDAGGNQGVFGTSPAGGAWIFGIKHPRSEGELLGGLALSEGAVSTSGDSERGFWHEGVRYGHIVDPLSGAPVQGRFSVTVVAPSAEAADALSTALYVLGVEKGKRLLAAYPGSHALFVEAGSRPEAFSYTPSAGFRWTPLDPAPSP